MRSNHRRPIVALLAIALGLCLITCVVIVLLVPPTGRTTTAATPPPVTSNSIGLSAECYHEQVHASALSLEQARAAAAPILPTDAQLVRTYNPSHVPELTVDLYNSAWLKDRYTSWPGAGPGDFIVIYGPSPNAVGRTVIACGNQP